MKEITENDLEAEPENILLSLNQCNNCNKGDKTPHNHRESPRTLRDLGEAVSKSSITLSRVNVQNARKRR